MQKIHLVRFLGGWFPEFPTFSFWLEDEFDEEKEVEYTSMYFDRNPEGKNIKETVLTTIKNKFSEREFTRDELMAELPCEISVDWLKRILTNLVKLNTISKVGNTKNTKYFFTKEGAILYSNPLETALHKEKDWSSDWSIPPQIILQSSGEYSNQYANPNPLVEPISEGLRYSEKEYANQYANPNPRPTRLSGGLEYSIPLNTPKIFWEQEKITNSPPEEISRCKYCGEPITWGKDTETGQWLPMRPDYKSFHRCQKEVKH